MESGDILEKKKRGERGVRERMRGEKGEVGLKEKEGRKERMRGEKIFWERRRERELVEEDICIENV